MKKYKLFFVFCFVSFIYASLPETGYPLDTGDKDTLDLEAVKDDDPVGESTDEGTTGTVPKDDKTTATDETEGEEIDNRSLLEKTLGEDINTATYYELARWCKQLGIDDAGDLNALKTRIFNYYKVKPEERKSGAAQDVSKKIEIKSAQRSEYFTIEEVDENYLLLEGDVIVEVYDYKDNVKHEIKAHRIILNQTENVLTAEEDIEYVLTRQEGEPEKFKGESFSFDINTWEGVFYRSRGETEKKVDKEKTSKFVYMGETISRLSNDTIILNKGTITSDASPDSPYWKIKATKIWVLAPGEWAVQDLVLYVGEVPVLYFPFFFYPGDELFFHPILGYKEREGDYLQTTTYIIGEKEDKESPFSFLRVTEDDTNKYKKEIKGLFLRTTDTKLEIDPKKKDWYLKIMADVYTRLGGFLGIDGNFPPAFSIKGGIALSRNVYYDGIGYTEYDPLINDELKDDWNETSIFGFIIPFRYALNTTFNVVNPIATVNGSIELFSDPFFSTDFYEREETFDIAKLVGMEDLETVTTTPSIQSTLNWSVNSTFNLSNYMPKPYINTLNVTQCYVDFDWGSKLVETPEPTPEGTPFPTISPVDPSRQFYYPDRLVLPNIKMSVQGTLLTLPLNQPTPAPPAQATPETGKTPDGNPADGNPADSTPGLTFRLPAAIAEETPAPAPEPGEEQNEADLFPAFKEPALKVNAPGVVFRNKNTTFNLSYSLLPEMIIEHQFYDQDWYSLEYVDFDAEYSHFQGIVPISLSYVLNIWGDFLRFNGMFTMSNKYQTMFNLHDDLLPATVDSYELRDHQNTGVSVNKVFTTTVRPLIDIPEFTTTSLEYNVNWLFYKYGYDPEVTDDIVYKTEVFEWEEAFVTSHSAKATLIFKPGEYPYTYYFYTTLPPRLIQIDTYLEFYIWLFKTRINTGFNEVDPDNAANSLLDVNENGWIEEPITITEELTINNLLTFKQALDYDPENEEWEDTTSNLMIFKLKPTDPLYLFEQELIYSIQDNKIIKSRSACNLFGLRIELLAEMMKNLTWNVDTSTWIAEDPEGTEEFLLNYLDIKYNLVQESYYFWKYRVLWQPSVISTFRYYFEDFTESELTFTLNMNFSIAEFVDLNFQAISYNKSIYRYIPGIEKKPGFESVSYINPFEDLLKSFNFFNNDHLRTSSFKRKYLSVSLVHHLYDWDLTYTLSGKYEPQYDEILQRDNNIWTQVFSIFVEWKPIPEIKKEVTGDSNGLNIGG
ncbi:MAG: hypothetical protein JXJ04_08860 [Spirochaetales bacterium]|nr:hypothetical protein [Spirochaetales bacterium]